MASLPEKRYSGHKEVKEGGTAAISQRNLPTGRQGTRRENRKFSPKSREAGEIRISPTSAEREETTESSSCTGEEMLTLDQLGNIPCAFLFPACVYKHFEE